MVTIDELAQLPLFSGLGPRELAYLAGIVPDIHLQPGEYLIHEGDGRTLIIVVAGKLEVTKVIDGLERVIGQRVPGALFGEVPTVLSTPFPASLRAVEPSRVIRVDPKVFHTVAASAPEVAVTVAKAAVGRIGGLQELAKNPKRPEVLVVGPRWLPAIHAVRSFLHRNQIDFEFLEPGDPELEGRELGSAVAAGRFPIVRVPGGELLVEPSAQTIAPAVGLSIAPSRGEYDVVIIGGGPAGMAAAVYSASEGLATLLVEREAPGGQAGTSSRIENYLGFPFGVSGDELATKALQQARRLGAEIVVTRSVERIDVASRTLTLDGGQALHARTLVLALGVNWRRLAIESLDRLTGRGVYYGAARTEAPSTQGRDIFLVGAGNSAGQAAVFFANHARKVTLVVRGETLGKSMSHYLTQQLASKPNIEVALQSEVVAVHGSEQLEALDIVDRRTGRVEHRTAGALFVFIGADAATGWLPAEIARDKRGYVLTGLEAARSGLWPGGREPYLLETTAPGVFAVGDVRAGSVKRVASAVGDGSLAISFVQQYLDERARG